MFILEVKIAAADRKHARLPSTYILTKTDKDNNYSVNTFKQNQIKKDKIFPNIALLHY